MRSIWRRAGLSGLLAVMLTGPAGPAACTRSDGPQLAAQVVADPQLQALLRHVPADTPYAFIGMGGAGTREFMAKIYAPLAPLFQQLEGKLGELPGVGDDAVLRAVFEELRGKLSVDGMASLGLDIDARFALYGIGVLPAMRWQLRDPAALRAAIERVQTHSGKRFPTRKLGEIEYWHISTGGPVDAAIAIVGDQLVAGAAPTGLGDRVFALLLGSELPAQHLGGSERFQAMLAEHDLARVSAGFIDLRVLAESFLGEGDPLSKDVLAALSPAVAARWPELDDVCKQEIRSLVAIVPRMVFGTEKIDADGFAGKLIVELRPDIAQELMAMRASVPGLDPDTIGAPVLAMGGGIDMDRLLTFVQTRAVAIQAAPYACPHLAELNSTASELTASVKQLPPEVWKTRGGALVAEEVKLAGFLPTEIRGYLTVAHADPGTLLAPLRSIPPFDAHPLTDDGEVRSLPDGAIPFLTGVSYAAQTGRGAAIALGPDSAARVGSLLSAKPQDDPPLLLMIYDMGRFGELMGQVMSGLGQPSPPELQALLEFYKATGTLTYDLRASERGLVTRTSMKLR